MLSPRAGVLFLLLVACSTEEKLPGRLSIERERTYRTTNGYPAMFAKMDQRRDGMAPSHDAGAAPEHQSPTSTPAPHRSAPTGEAAPAEKLHAVESERGSERTYVLAPGRPAPRWEVRALADRCSRRPTQWARERCMEDGQ